MQISWKWLSECVDLSSLKGPAELAEKLTARGLEVEEIRPQGKGFEHVVTVKILERNKHPQADRLSICMVSLGSGEPLQIVCGAQNMKAGDVVCLAQVGAHLPNDMKIKKGEIRGVVSNGMLCSEAELKLPETVDGLLILPPDTKPGLPAAQVLGLDDITLVFKPTANRGDCLSHRGIAREAAAVVGKPLKMKTPAGLSTRGLAVSPISVSLDACDAGPQFFGALVDGVKVGPSPTWVVKRLEAIGQRSINNVVDATNLVMFELGQPTHAYDATKIRGGKLSIQRAQAGAKFPLLDGTEAQLDGTELVIADGGGPVALAGVMGGGNSEVQDSTTQLFLECAEFDPVLVRRTARKHQKRTEACIRFEKGIDSQALEGVISRLADLVVELAGGKITAFTAQRAPARDPQKNWKAPRIAVAANYFADFLGAEIPGAEAKAALESIGCKVEGAGDSWTVQTPSWRLDLALKEDLSDEVARVVGLDRIPSTPPRLYDLPSPSQAEKGWSESVLMMRAKRALAGAGLQETLNYSATSKAWLAKFGLTAQARIQNPLTEDMQEMTPALLPLLVKNAQDQERFHFGSEPLAIRLFEIRPAFFTEGGAAVAQKSPTETNVTEHWRVGFALGGPRFAGGLKADQAAIEFADVKAVFETLIEEMGTKGIRLTRLSDGPAPGAKLNPHLAGLKELFHPGQSVEVLAGQNSLGFFGLLHPKVSAALKLRSPLWVGEFDWKALLGMSRGAFSGRTFKAWSEFPPMERDYALLVKSDITADKITSIALKAGKPIAKSAKIFDVYRGAQVAEGMTSVAVRVIFQEDQRSLQDAETEGVSVKIVEAWRKELGATLRS